MGRGEALGLALDDPAGAAFEPAVRALEPRVQLGEVGHDETAGDGGRRGADVGGEVAERRVLLVPDRRDDRTGSGDGADEPLVRERQQVLERAAAAGEHDDVGAALAKLAECGRDLGRGARALDVRLGHETCAGGNRS